MGRVGSRHIAGPAGFVAIRTVDAVHHGPPAVRPPVFLDLNLEGHRAAMPHQANRVDDALVRQFEEFPDPAIQVPAQLLYGRQVNAFSLLVIQPRYRPAVDPRISGDVRNLQPLLSQHAR